MALDISQAISEAEDGQHHRSGDTRSAGGSLVQGLGCKGLDEVHRPGVPESAHGIRCDKMSISPMKEMDLLQLTRNDNILI
jgi:hypothetical protein